MRPFNKKIEIKPYSLEKNIVIPQFKTSSQKEIEYGYNNDSMNLTPERSLVSLLLDFGE